MEVTISENDLQILKEILQIAPFILKLAQDVAKNGVKTALPGISDANLETLCSPSFTETKHTDFILNSPGEYKSPRRDITNADIIERINELTTQIGYHGIGNRVKLDEIKEWLSTLTKAVAGIKDDVTHVNAINNKVGNVINYCSSIDLQLNNGFNESINAIQKLESGVNFTFSDAMADHLGGIFTELKAIKEKVSDWGRPNDIKGSTLNPMYPVSRADYQRAITDPIPTQQTLPVQPLLTHKVSEPLILMEDVFQQAVVNEQAARNEAAFEKGLELLGNIGAFD